MTVTRTKIAHLILIYDSALIYSPKANLNFQERIMGGGWEWCREG